MLGKILSIHFTIELKFFVCYCTVSKPFSIRMDYNCYQPVNMQLHLQTNMHSKARRCLLIPNEHSFALLFFNYVKRENILNNFESQDANQILLFSRTKIKKIEIFFLMGFACQSHQVDNNSRFNGKWCIDFSLSFVYEGKGKKWLKNIRCFRFILCFEHLSIQVASSDLTLELFLPFLSSANSIWIKCSSVNLNCEIKEK